MQRTLAIIGLFLIIYAIVWIKSRGYSFTSVLRVFIKRLALRITSFSWILAFAAIFMSACYSDLSSVCKAIMPAHTISAIKSVVRFVFGVDSVFVALQMLTFYSVMTSFVSCLVLALGVVVVAVYKTILKVSRTAFVEEEQCVENNRYFSQPTFKLYLKYNS